jgi:hypothetical protein
VELQKRYDDFVKLHEGLLTIPGVTLPSLPPKQLFGGNDAKVVEERRPALEKYLKECILSEKVMADSKECMHKFLEISPSGTLVVQYLSETDSSLRDTLVTKISEQVRDTTKCEKDHYRVFSESVLRSLLSEMKSTENPTSTVSRLENLQYILSKAHSHPLADKCDIQSLFVSLGGIHIVWNLLTLSLFREPARRTLSSLISSNLQEIDRFEALFFEFVSRQKGLTLLFETCDSEELHEITAKLVWFGLSDSVQSAIAKHPQGLGLLGKFFASPDPHARCLAGLALSVLIPKLDEQKSSRAIDGVASILASLVTNTSSLQSPSQAVLSAVCRGSSNGINRLKTVIQSGCSPMSDFCVWLVQQAQLPFEFIDRNGIETVIEEVVLGSSDNGSVAHVSGSLFLYRLYEEGKRFPLARSDNRTGELLSRIQIGISNHFEQTKKLISAEHGQYAEFQRVTIGNNFERIKTKNTALSPISVETFSDLVKAVDMYKHSFTSLETRVGTNCELIKSLGDKLGGDTAPWGKSTNINSELLRSWNQSLVGMSAVQSRLSALQTALSVKESEAKSAQNDANNLQQVISNMRVELSNVDSRAEEFRNDSSRFTTAAGGAVNPDDLLAKAKEMEIKAKEEIAKREALRQSQDSLESQLSHARASIVEAESRAAELRKSISESQSAIKEAETHHAELEKMLRGEMDTLLTSWNDKLANNNASLAIIDSIVKNCDAINKLIASENEQKDEVSAIIASVVQQLQSLQLAITGA